MSDILANLHPFLRIAWEEIGPYGTPATAEYISDLLAEFPSAPEEYLELVRQHSFLSFKTKDDAPCSFSLALISPADVIGWQEWYPWLLEDFSDAFFFATDGDMAFFVNQDVNKLGVFKLQVSASMWEYTDFLAPSIYALLCEGVGWASEENSCT